MVSAQRCSPPRRNDAFANCGRCVEPLRMRDCRQLTSVRPTPANCASSKLAEAALGISRRCAPATPLRAGARCNRQLEQTRDSCVGLVNLIRLVIRQGSGMTPPSLTALPASLEGAASQLGGFVRLHGRCRAPSTPPKTLNRCSYTECLLSDETAVGLPGPGISMQPPHTPPVRFRCAKIQYHGTLSHGDHPLTASASAAPGRCCDCRSARGDR